MKKSALLLVSLALLVLGASACGQGQPPTPSPEVYTPTSAPPTPTATAVASGRISSQEMAQILARVDVPSYDKVDRKVRLGILSQPVPRTVAGPAMTYSVGDVANFLYVDTTTGERRTVPAELRCITDHTYMWFESGAVIDQSALTKAAGRFDDEIYDTVRDYFGEEWSPGVDNDPRISILHLSGMGQYMALFGTGDEFTLEVDQNSNQREMIYVNLDGLVIGDDSYLGMLAHEFQHMIQWNVEGNEAHWFDEALSQLGERLAGFDTVDTHSGFLLQSRIQLNDWVAEPGGELPHYGGAYLYALYLWERLGDDFVRTLARHPGESLASVDAALAEQGLDLTADDLFAYWIVANYVDDPTLADGRYGYEYETLGPICPRQRYAALPVDETRTVPQYAAEYIEVEGQGDLTIDFKGATEARLVPAEAHSGYSFWWSHRGEEAETNLTRAFDLSGLERATLQFWTCYDIKETGNFACVSVSTDGGETWSFPSGKQAAHGPFYPCYTASSGTGREPQWVLDEIDLSPYAGQEILLRFEYITESWPTGPGFAVDDVAIPELDYTYDAETGDDGWEAAGFVRTSNAVPQSWALQMVTPGDQTTVERLHVADDGTARGQFTLGNGVRKAALIIGATAPVTREEASYEIRISGQLAGVPPAEPDVLLQDNFGDPCGPWETYSDGIVEKGYADGGYVMEAKTPAQFLWTKAGQDFTDVVIDVDTTQEVPAVDNGWGVICRYQDDGNFYFFEITNDGFAQLTAFVKGQQVSLVNWTATGAIRQGQGAANHLRATCSGDRLALEVNGQAVAEVRDSKFNRGDVGLIAATGSQAGARILFDDFVVRRP